MKQMTMRVEWYYGDFSDPEAVSGSSTTLIEKSAMRSFFDAGGAENYIRMYTKMAVENSAKNYKKSIQKVIDESIFGAYNRDSS